MTGLTAWFLILTVCSAAQQCADLLMPGAPFYNEIACMEAGWEHAELMAELGGYTYIEIRCEEWPLERP